MRMSTIAIQFIINIGILAQQLNLIDSSSNIKYTCQIYKLLNIIIESFISI